MCEFQQQPIILLKLRDFDPAFMTAEMNRASIEILGDPFDSFQLAGMKEGEHTRPVVRRAVRQSQRGGSGSVDGGRILNGVLPQAVRRHSVASGKCVVKTS